MTINKARCQGYLQSFNFTGLFIEELGWDRYNASLVVSVGEESYTLKGIAEKRGMPALCCDPASGGNIPPYPIRRKIEAQVAKSFREHLIIFIDGAQSLQVWQWVRREMGRPAACREQTFYSSGTGEALLQKLNYLAFGIEEEEILTVVDVAIRARLGFDVERVTRRFYDVFKKERDAFAGFLTGIPDEELQNWYVSVMLNRLIFIYFIQKKGFLDGNLDYLRDQLSHSMTQGSDRFYKGFLCPLFFEGFARKETERSAETNHLLGRIPYLNGGLFLRHQVEELHGESIQISDQAFDRLFSFFEQYQWHLDERPLRQDNEINPDVLGYIFEKYINQKQMGAYYTKGDITEYISKNTILPYLLDQVRQSNKKIFDNTAWPLLQEEPDRYIYPSVQHGVKSPLPSEISVGLNDVSRRGEWNKPAPTEYALPTEIWREVITRRQRYEEVRQNLSKGEIRQVDDLITYNLDIRQFCQDVVENIDNSELLRVFWKELSNVKILDPTVGSGAFLFAALNILEPLYEACLERMQAFLNELEASGEKHRPEKYKDFRLALEQVASHLNQRYFILKSIIVNNLFGVDIMEEAVEICKLRLFLKLVAQVDDPSHIEPLPDIDFNIRAGNTLVGFVTLEEVRRATEMTMEGQRKLGFKEEKSISKRIEEKAVDVENLFQSFRQQQTVLGGEVTPKDKEELRSKLKALEGDLNRYLAREYAIHNPDSDAYRNWLDSHKPFHWFVEFYGIMKSGGFDVIIGNPPYVELSAIRDYKVINFETEESGNLYALCLERSAKMLTDRGLLGMVVQQPYVSTKRMQAARQIILQNAKYIYSSTFDDRPSKLFEGTYHSRIAIILVQKGKPNNGTHLYVTPYQKWYKEERNFLFNKLHYIKSHDHSLLGIFPKMGSVLEGNILNKVISQPSCFSTWINPINTGHCLFYKITGVGHWFTITIRPPRFIRGGEESASTRESSIFFRDQNTRDRAFCLLNSSLFYWFYQLRTNCRDFNPSDYRTFPIPKNLSSEDFSKLASLLQKKLDKSATFIRVSHKKTGSIEYEQFKPRESKSIIDIIDGVLAQHYGFTDEESDFLINYEIKYRMGGELEGDEE